jgi:hypothetical protein
MEEKNLTPELQGRYSGAEMKAGEQPPEADLELDREYRILAQWLLDVHREGRERRRGVPERDGAVDNLSPKLTM